MLNIFKKSAPPKLPNADETDVQLICDKIAKFIVPQIASSGFKVGHVPIEGNSGLGKSSGYLYGICVYLSMLHKIPLGDDRINIISIWLFEEVYGLSIGFIILQETIKRFDSDDRDVSKGMEKAKSDLLDIVDNNEHPRGFFDFASRDVLIEDEPENVELLGEPRPYGVRIMALNPEEREKIARHRFLALDKHLKSAGCATTPSPKDYAVNFHTGDHLFVVRVDPDDPRQIRLDMMYGQKDGDIVKARSACFEATSKQFASKATVEEYGDGYLVTLGVGVYAEALHSFGDSLKSYVDDIIKLNQDFIEIMVRDDALDISE